MANTHGKYMTSLTMRSFCGYLQDGVSEYTAEGFAVHIGSTARICNVASIQGSSQEHFRQQRGRMAFWRRTATATFSRVTICSAPFLKLNARMRELLANKNQLKIDVRIVYGKSELQPQETECLSGLTYIRTSFCKNLNTI